MLVVSVVSRPLLARDSFAVTNDPKIALDVTPTAESLEVTGIAKSFSQSRSLLQRKRRVILQRKHEVPPSVAYERSEVS